MDNQPEIPYTHPRLEEIMGEQVRKDLLENVSRAAHKAIHSGAETVMLDGNTFHITKAGNGCRCVLWKDITFMEQNKHKSSRYAQMAREGRAITWGIRWGNWIYITDTEVGVWRDGKLEPL